MRFATLAACAFVCATAGAVACPFTAKVVCATCEAAGTTSAACKLAVRAHCKTAAGGADVFCANFAKVRIRDTRWCVCVGGVDARSAGYEFVRNHGGARSQEE